MQRVDPKDCQRTETHDRVGVLGGFTKQRNFVIDEVIARRGGQ